MYDIASYEKNRLIDMSEISKIRHSIRHTNRNCMRNSLRKEIRNTREM